MRLAFEPLRSGGSHLICYAYGYLALLGYALRATTSPARALPPADGARGRRDHSRVGISVDPEFILSTSGACQRHASTSRIPNSGTHVLVTPPGLQARDGQILRPFCFTIPVARVLTRIGLPCSGGAGFIMARGLSESCRTILSGQRTHFASWGSKPCTCSREDRAGTRSSAMPNPPPG